MKGNKTKQKKTTTATATTRLRPAKKLMLEDVILRDILIFMRIRGRP